MAYTVFIAACSLLLFVYNGDTRASIWLHYAVSPFVYGVSKFKVNFFLVYFILLSLIALVPRRNVDGRPDIRLIRSFFLSSAAALAAGFSSYILFVRKFSLPLEKYAYHFKGNYHSINYFAHIHTSKVSIAYLLGWLGLGRFNRVYDTGYVFAGQVVPWTVAILSASVVAAFILSLLLLNPVLGQWPRRSRVFVFLPYAFACAHTLKCLIDGGIFSYDLLPSLLALDLLFSSYDPSSLLETLKKRWKYYFAAVAVYLGVCSIISMNDALLQVPIGFSFMAAFFLLLFLPLFADRARSPKFIAAALAGFLLVAFYWSMHGWSAIATMSRRLGPGDRVLTFDYPDPAGPPVVTDQSVRTAGMRMIDAYRALGENPLRNRRVAIIRKGSEPTTGFIFVLKIMDCKGGIKLGSTDLMHIDELKPFPPCGNKAYQLRVSFDPRKVPPLWSDPVSVLNQNNEYCMLFLLNHYLTQSGITEYAVVPYYYFNVGPGK